MLLATVGDKFEHHHLGGLVVKQQDYTHYQDDVSSASSSYSDYQPFLMPQEYNQQHNQYLAQTSGAQQPAITSVQHAQSLMFRPPVSNAEMTYLGQTLVPHGYPSGHPQYDQIIRTQQLEAWQQEQQISPTQQQAHYFNDLSLQAGTRTSFSSSRASIDISAHHNQHMQSALMPQLPPNQHHSPHSEYIISGLPHHHHSMPSHSPNTQSSEHGESSRERDGGAPNVVGQEGMPEPAARPKGPKLKFTRADDALLVELKESKNLTWKQISDFFPGRSSGTLQVRYCTKLKAKTTVWTDDMVQRLKNAMMEYENERWRIISSKVGNGFSATACQDKALEMELEENPFLMNELDEEDEYQPQQ